MNAIEFLKNEHRNVERILKVIKNMSYKVLKDDMVDYNDFNIIIDCIRNYADKIHHKKEEDFLFDMMIKELPEAIRKTIQFGMLVEHDQGRLFVTELEKALLDYNNGSNDIARLDIISNAMGYVGLLERHISKEDKVVFEFADKHLSVSSKEILNLKFSEIVEKEESSQYIAKIEKLEKKYI
ncbi:MAG: hemerythrin domain-containing protein [Sarcina sp.]